MTESAGASQAGGAAPDVERLIAQAKWLVTVLASEADYVDNEFGDPENEEPAGQWLRRASTTVERIAKALSAALTREAEASAYIGRLLHAFYPELNLLDDLLGRCTQIDNMLTGMIPKKQSESREAAFRAENERLREAIESERKFGYTIRLYRGAYDSIGYEESVVRLKPLEATIAAVERPPQT